MTAERDPIAQARPDDGPSSAPDELIQRSCELLTRHGEIRARRGGQPGSRAAAAIAHGCRHRRGRAWKELAGQLTARPVGRSAGRRRHHHLRPPDGSCHPRPSSPTARCGWSFPSSSSEEIAPEELADWVTVSGTMVNDPNVERLPIAAEISAEAMHLPGVHIVDTPGVNGLNPSHIESAVTATKGASVLLMVCDATASISKPELDFLRRVSAEIGSVVLAVTKTDLATLDVARPSSTRTEGSWPSMPRGSPGSTSFRFPNLLAERAPSRAQTPTAPTGAWAALRYPRARAAPAAPPQRRPAHAYRQRDHGRAHRHREGHGRRWEEPRCLSRRPARRLGHDRAARPAPTTQGAPRANGCRGSTRELVKAALLSTSYMRDQS